MNPNCFRTPQRALLIMVAMATLVQAADQRPTVTVARTEARGPTRWHPTMGESLAQMLITELSTLPNLTVLESVALDDIRAERALGEHGEVAETESVKRGQWKGADYTFKSAVTRFGNKENNYGANVGALVPKLPFGIPSSFSVKKVENEVQIDWRFIDNASREIITGASGRGVGIETGTSFNLSGLGESGFNNNKEFRDSALGKATMKAIAQITEKVRTLQLGAGARSAIVASATQEQAATLRSVKGVVKLVDGKDIWVSLGATNGFAKGDKVKIFKPVEKKNKKGEVVAITYDLVAEIVLLKVQKDKSMGEYTGTVAIAEDWAAVESSVDIERFE